MNTQYYVYIVKDPISKTPVFAGVSKNRNYLSSFWKSPSRMNNSKLKRFLLSLQETGSGPDIDFIPYPDKESARDRLLEIKASFRGCLFTKKPSVESKWKDLPDLIEEMVEHNAEFQNEEMRGWHRLRP